MEYEEIQTIEVKGPTTLSQHPTHKQLNIKFKTWQKLTELKAELNMSHSGIIEELITEYINNRK